MSERSEKDKMKDRVRKRAERYKKMREQSVRDKTYTQVIFEFLKEMEKVYSIAKNDDDFKAMLDATCRLLDSKMKVFDHYVKMEIMWNDGESFDTLRATGVTINWSPYYLRKNPGAQSPEYIDVTQFLLEDLEL